MIGDVPIAPLMGTSAASRRSWTTWQRRTIESVVALLAMAIWGKLAYLGGFRILARLDGVQLHGSWALDVLSFVIGVSGSIAGISALYALSLRIVGRTPKSLVGAPDDSPEDYPQRVRTDEHVSAP